MGQSRVTSLLGGGLAGPGVVVLTSYLLFVFFTACLLRGMRHGQGLEVACMRRGFPLQRGGHQLQAMWVRIQGDATSGAV